MDQTAPEGTTPEGLGGWLLLVLLSIWVNAVATLVAGVSALAATFHLRTPSAYPTPMEPFTAVVAGVAGISGAVAGYLLLRKNPVGPTVARMLMALTAGYSLLSLAETFLRTGPVPVEPVPAWIKPASYFVASVLALGYLLRSRRVVATYAPRPDGPSPDEMFGRDKALDALSNRIFRWEELRSGEASSPEASSSALPASEAATPLLSASVADEPQTPEPESFEPLVESLHVGQPDTQENPQESSTPEMNPPLKTTRNGTHSESETQELAALKAQIAAGVGQWLDSGTNSDYRSPSKPASLFAENRGSSGNNDARQKLLDQVSTICDQGWSVHIGESPTLPNTPDSEGSLPAEIQKWAIAQAVFRLTRSLDIRAAMEVYGPFEKVAQDREYLMAVGQKNSSEDAFGRKVDVAEYESHSAPEIAYKLILRAKRDMFEADMWARVASLAGDAGFLNRFAGGGAKAFEDSVEYWRGYANRLRDERLPVPAIEAGYR